MALQEKLESRLMAGAIVALGLSIALFAAPAHGGLIAPDLGFMFQVNGEDALHFYPPGVDVGEGWWSWQGAYSEEAPVNPPEGWLPGWNLTYDILANTDPQVNLAINITNTTLATNIYTLDVTLPTGVFVAPNLIGGSVGGSVTDNNGNGATLVAGNGLGTSLYSGMIDGAVVAGAPPIGAQLYFSPATFIAPASGTVGIPAINFGLPGPSQLNLIAVATSIGIRLQFSLTPGDSAVISSSFILEPIPAPGGLALLGLFGLSMRRRRR